MKRSIAMLVPSALALAALSGCASQQPPAELTNARAAFNRAQAGPAAVNNRAGLMEAEEALEQAEQRFETTPGADEVKTLGHVAQRKAEIAEAEARAVELKNQQQEAERIALQMEADQARRMATEERGATEVAERRAKVALDRLGLAAKDEPRGTVVTLPGADMFASNKAEILPEAKERLTAVAEAIKSVVAEQAPADEGRKIMLIGYTDDRGSDEHNMKLSERRAESVRDFFAEQGVDEQMLEAEGRGEAEPVASNETPEGRADNRRVEIVITPPGTGEGMTAPEGMPMPESAPPEGMPESTPETTPESMPDTMPETMPDTMPDTMPGGTEPEEP